MAWTQSGQVSAASVLEGVFEFNVVVPNSISTFEAFGTRPNLTGTGLTFVFQDSNPDGVPTRTDGISTQYAIHGAARVYQRQVLVGDGPAPGTRVGRLYVQDTAVSPAWTVPGGYSSGKPLRSAATFGRNGFIAVGDVAEVWITDPNPPTAPPEISPSSNLNSWSRVDLHAVGMLAPGEDPNLYGVARVGDAEVIVGENLTVIVYRPQPPLWVPRGQTWHPWTRINLAGMAPRHPGSLPNPALRAVAVDEVQEIIRPDLRDPPVDGKRASFLDSDGWVLAVGDDGAAFRFRIHLSRADAGRFGDPAFGAVLDDDSTLPGPSLQVLEVTPSGLAAANYDQDSDGYYDGDFLAVAADERTRMIVGKNNTVFTFPRYATFNDELMLDKHPTVPGSVAPGSIEWRGVASDNVTWFLVGKGSVGGLSIGAYWYGEQAVHTCRVSTDADPAVATAIADINACLARPSSAAAETMPSTNAASYVIGEARVSVSQAGEPEHHTRPTVSATSPTAFEFTKDLDVDVELQLWKANLEYAGEQVELFVMPDLQAPGGPAFSPYTTYVEDFVFNRGLNTFATSGAPATLVNGHIRDVITADVFTGLHSVGGALVEPTPTPGVPGSACEDPSRDQVAIGNSDLSNGYLEADASTLLAGFSRFRSADGHGYVDNYEAAYQGKGQRYQSMKHYAFGRCRQRPCRSEDPGCDDTTWTDDCCDTTEAGLSPKADLVDLFAPFTATVVQLPNPGEIFDPAPTSGQPLEPGHWSSQPAGNDAGGRACSFFQPSSDIDDITADQGRLALFLHTQGARDYKVAIVFDHVETCLDLSAGSAEVIAGQRVAHFMTHGQTEVAMWVNDRDGRWRAVSYFDELPNELYAIYTQSQWGFTDRTSPYDDHSPAIPLELRDQCPVHPLTPPTDKKLYPDNQPSRIDCDTVRPVGGPSPYACDTATCPADFIWRDDMHMATDSVMAAP